MMDLLFGFGRGPWNELVEIKVGDETAWKGPACADETLAIKKPDLFGGEQKEGGIQGPFRILWGGKDQVLPGASTAYCGSTGPMSGVQVLPAIKTSIGGLFGELRGTTMLWFTGLVTSLNPYPKQWAFRGRRYSAGWYDDVCWYPSKSLILMSGEYVPPPSITREEIMSIMLHRFIDPHWTPPPLTGTHDGNIRAMNPAHILFQCFTDPEWGRGYPWSRMGDSFIYAANTLCWEGFGLCFVWQRKEQNLDDFIDMVCSYIGGVWYTDPETGKIELRLVRNDYDPEALPLFTRTTGLIDIVEDDATSTDDAYNEIVGTGHDPVLNEDFSVRVHNLAARISQGAPNTQDVDYKGIPTKHLMARVLLRDLRIQAAGLKKFKVTLDRRAFKLRPGMPFRIADPRRNIGNIVLRVGQIDDKSFKDGRLTVSAMQDVYGLPETAFTATVDSTWTPPTRVAVPAAAEAIFEANYRDLSRRLDPSVLNSLAPTDSIMGVVALSPNTVMYQFDLRSRATGETSYSNNTGSFTGAAKLAANIAPLQTSFVVSDENAFDASNVDQGIMCGDEQMALVSYDAATHTVTVKRGCGDTVPQAHASGAYLWTIDDDTATDERRYVSGETVEAKVLTRTASDLLDEATATLLSKDMVGRQAMPYPPAKVTVDGVEALTLDAFTAHAEPVIDWVHRDRLLQMDHLVGYTEASVGPEPGTTYNVRVYDALAAAGSPPLRTVTGLTAGPWTYDATMRAADGSPNLIVVELESERDGLTSYQLQRFGVTLEAAGYGFDYGGSYGG